MCKETFFYHECCCRFVSSLSEHCGCAHPRDLTPESYLFFLSERCAECTKSQSSSSTRLYNQKQELTAERKSKASQQIAALWNERKLDLRKLNQYSNKREEKGAWQDTYQGQHVEQLPQRTYRTPFDDSNEVDSWNDAVLGVSQPVLSGNRFSRIEAAPDVLNDIGQDIEDAYYPNVLSSSSNHNNPEKFGNTLPLSDMSIPLSELLLDVPLVETEVYIRRPREFREKEWKNRHNFPKMPRPMNSFLLYRRAISERAKRHAGTTNNQVVSKIAGASWKNESNRVKDIFDNYAKLEQKYHRQAFPGYKFKPRKTHFTKASKGRRNKEDRQGLNNGDSDPEYLGRNNFQKTRPKIRSRQPHNAKQSSLYSGNDLETLNSDYHQLPYPINPSNLSCGGGYRQMLTNYDPWFDKRESQVEPQLDITSSAATQLGLSGDHHDPLLGNAVAIKQSEHFDANPIDPNLFDINSDGDGFYLNAYNGHENSAPNNLEHTQEGDFLMSSSPNQNYELDKLSRLINSPEPESIFDDIKE